MHSVGAADSCLGASFTCGREITCTYAPLVPTVVLQPDRCSQCVNGRHIRSVAQLNLGIKTPAAGPCLSGASSAVSVWLCASLAVCLLSPVVVASWSVLAAGPVWCRWAAPGAFNFWSSANKLLSRGCKEAAGRHTFTARRPVLGIVICVCTFAVQVCFS